MYGTNSQGTDWADSTASFVSENALDASTGTVTFNTNGPKPTWSSTGGQGGSGQLVTTSYTDAGQNTITYTVARYDFDRINIGDGASVTLTGTNPIFLNVAGDATILADLDANGSDGQNAARAFCLESLEEAGGWTQWNSHLGSRFGSRPFAQCRLLSIRGRPLQGVGQPRRNHFHWGTGARWRILRRSRRTARGGRWPSSIRYPGCLRQSLWGCRPDQPVRRLRRRGRKRSTRWFRGRSDQDRIHRHPDHRR